MLVTRGRRFVWGDRTYVMGIVNVTPDSFSGDGRMGTDEAFAHARSLHEAGADVIDIGAESTRPGATPVDAREEGRRLLPLVERLRATLPDVVLSIDTSKAGVFAQAHRSGADWLNSVWGLDDAQLALVAERNVPVVIMHNQFTARYERDVVDEVLRYLEAQARRALRAGLRAEAVILDPGIGFGKTAEHNLALLAALDRIVALGFPTLVGTSRKSTIGRLTGRDVASREFGTAATVALAVAAKVDIVRVHDVESMRDVGRVSDAIVRGWRPNDWSEPPTAARHDG